MANALYSSNQNIPQDMLLGNLVFMNLSDMRIPVLTMENIFIQSNLSTSYIRAISPADAFRRATSSVKNTKRFITGQNGNTAEIKFEVDEVRCDNSSIKRIIGAKSIDDVNEDVEYESMIEVYFNRTTSQINCNCVSNLYTLNASNMQVFDDIIKDITDKYNEWTVYHNKDTVKNIITRIMQSIHPINLMPTGLCKFIPKCNADTLYALKDALTLMSDYKINAGDHDNICEIIPVIDTDEQRDLINKNFESEVQEEMTRFVQELRDVIVRKQTLTSTTAANYIKKFNDLKSKITEYEDLLGVYTQAIHSQITRVLDFIDDNVNSDDGNVDELSA